MPLYTPEQRRRRDESPWTLVQGILAPVQFLIFLVSLGLVLRYLVSGEGALAATASIVVKTAALYLIMVTGSIWEKEVYDKWLFANAFFWEDLFSFLVLALHTGYLVMLIGGLGTPREQMFVALAGYAAYVINATQFVLKLRAARLQTQTAPAQQSSVTRSDDAAADMRGDVGVFDPAGPVRALAA
ncbi:MAG: 2-vinyl bacteriochlorophyllide hydratase [Sphingomonas sp.]|nr:2-vinyl bacteriochlorophyllide hydratase [Sphingomonas sp.]